MISAGFMKKTKFTRSELQAAASNLITMKFTNKNTRPAFNFHEYSLTSRRASAVGAARRLSRRRKSRAPIYPIGWPP